MAENLNKTPLASSKTPGRRLGLRRSASKPQLDKTSKSTPQITPKRPSEITDETPQTPVTKSTVCLKSSTAFKITPKPESFIATTRDCKSTGGLVKKYRLSLNENIREKYTRKKLIFSTVDGRRDIPECEEIDKHLPSAESDNKCPLSIPPELHDLTIEEQVARLKTILEEKEHKLLTMKRHEAEIESLKSAITTWNAGCRDALDELRTLIAPPANTTEEILKHLGIPVDLIEY